MNKLISSVLIIALFAACNSAPTSNSDVKKDSVDTSSSAMTIQVPNTTCYQSIKGSDTVYLKLEKFPNVVTGTLKYKFHEKDSNTGEIDGKLNGDTLLADYKFMSEGQTSVRQVAFIITDNTATEGYGDAEEKDGKMIFKNPSSIDFSKGLELNKIDCPVE